MRFFELQPEEQKRLMEEYGPGKVARIGAEVCRIPKKNKRERLEKICLALDLSLPFSEIERQTGHSRRWVYLIRQRARRDPRKYLEVMKRFRDDGKGFREIGEIFGRSHEWIRKSLEGA